MIASHRSRRTYELVTTENQIHVAQSWLAESTITRIHIVTRQIDRVERLNMPVAHAIHTLDQCVVGHPKYMAGKAEGAVYLRGKNGWWRSLDLSKLSRRFSARCSKRFQFSRFELKTGLTLPHKTSTFNRRAEAVDVTIFYPVCLLFDIL